MSITYGAPVTEADLDALMAAELVSYPDDEKADRATLGARLRNANQYFRKTVAADGSLVGFVCATLCAGDALTEDTMYSHDPAGRHLCIHSVVTVPALRKQGHARKSLTAFLQHVKALGGIDRISLIAHDPLVGFYQSCGFTLLGLSPVVHGANPWNALTMDLKA